MTDTERKIRIPMSGSDTVHIDGLEPTEVELIRGSILGGHNWIRVDKEEGFQSVPSYEELPGPVLDQEMLPFWRKPTSLEVQISEEQPTLFNFDEMTESSSPSIIISSLCGYHYTPQRYKREAETLESYGFICMRSKRGPDGHYWENWFLPGLYSAKGDLEEAIDPRTIQGTRSEKKRLKKALEFLASNVSFGSLDVSVQRMAMPIPD